ncbi:MAG: aldolase/citrate lyase family protein [Myxococcota bacterium]
MGRVFPEDALADTGRTVPVLSACEHYAGNERFIDKALALQATVDRPFDLTLDLEDGAPVGREHAHLEMVCDMLAEYTPRRGRVGVRVHDIRHPVFMNEVEAVLGRLGHKVDYLVVPKTNDRGDVEYVSSVMQEIAKDTMREAMWPLHVLIESQRALHDLFPIAAHPQVETLDFGSMDFVSDHGGALSSACLRSPVQFEHALMRRAKTQIVAAALLNAVVPVHNVTLDVGRAEVAGADAKRAKDEFGFLRMWSIHPGQIEPIIEGMAPDPAETERAIAILLQAQDTDWGPIRFEDELHDRASYRYAWGIARRSHLAGRALAEDTVARLFKS